MAVNPGLTTTVPAGAPYFRITSLSFRTPNPADHVKVVNGQGAVNSSLGARYNYPGAPTIYLAEDLETCLAEKMFYFHREVLRGIDLARFTGVIPPFVQKFILWEIEFAQPTPNVFDMNIGGAYSYFGIFPCLTVNPSQDYEHLKASRALVQNAGYNGLRVQSSRRVGGGNMVVLFHDQSGNVTAITPHEIEFRLITPHGPPFYNHAHDPLNFLAGEVRVVSAAPPAGGGAYHHSWQVVNYNH